jgi:hypothetical protein
MGEEAAARLEDLADLATPWCIRVAATLSLPDHIADGAGDIAVLAERTGSDRDALHAVCSHLARRGVLAEPTPGRFTLTPVGEALREAGRFLALDGIGGRFALAWQALPTFVRTGRAAYREVAGQPFWADLAAHPALGAEFDALMGPAGHGEGEVLPLTGGWEAVGTVVDVGGGTGSLLAALLGAHPHLQGTLVDLPGTVARAVEHLGVAGVAERVRFVGQSFFDPLPAGADVYVLQKVLNDWPDRETVRILSRCGDAAGTDGRLLVAGGVRADDAPVALQLEMVLVGGRTDDLTTFRARAAEAGLEVVAAGPGARGRLVVELRRSAG